MTSATQSEYIRYNNKSALIRRWIAIILQRSDLESHLLFSRLEPVIVTGFDTSTFTKENQDDVDFIRNWLTTELKRCGSPSLDESDIFATNTRRIQKSMGLSQVELAILRFACLINGYKPLEATAELCAGSYTEADVCDLLADLLKKPFSQIYSALRPKGLLRQSGIVGSNAGWSGTQSLSRWLAIPDMLAREIFRAQDDDNLLVNVFYKVGPKSTLTQHDFPQRSELYLLKKYLRASIKEKSIGANVLLWGPPGTGKTEMARHLAQALRKKSLEINAVDADNRSLTAADRLDCYRFCQAILARSSNALVTFDEVEEILCDGSYSQWGFRGNAKFTKGLMNTILETNKTPAIWITNTVSGIDPAYLRRFDFVVNVKSPRMAVKRRIAWRTFKDLPVTAGIVNRLAGHRAITPAHMTKLSKICERVGVDTPQDVGVIANYVLNGDLKAVDELPVQFKKVKKNSNIQLPYRTDLINCDTDIEHLTENLRPGSSVRICSFGPPGTGKTAWARHLAETLKQPLLVKRAADILDKYVGGTEKNIDAIFKEAAATRSVLMLDEMDSFLPDRTNATRHWEVTQANQFLTAMEEYQGILICSTNLKDNLDPATMRRFDFKITFDYLKPEQACEVALDLLEMAKVEVSKESRGQLRISLTGLKLAHGDFAALLRRYAVLRTQPGWEQLVADLKTEASFRDKEMSRPIGFLANV